MSSPSSQVSSLVIAHDFLIQMGGAENVVEVIAEAFPEAPIYTSASAGENLFPVFKTDRVHNSWMQHIPGLAKIHKALFFVYPFAFKSLRIPKGSLAWISSSGFSKWLPKSEGSTFVCYCHTPPRYFWDPDEYLEHEVKMPKLRKLVQGILPLFRKSDWKQAQKVDYFIANSKNVQKRILKCYGKESTVIYPPVDVVRFQVSEESEDFHLIVSRLVAYKRIELAVRAFTKTGQKLIVIGDGPDRGRLESLAGDNIEFLGRAPNEVVNEKMAKCQSFIFPGSEDFGITPVEAQACGKPVIAFREGGALETVVDGETGVFFDEATPESLLAALEEFEKKDWDKQVIRKNAERFSVERFVEETKEFLAAIPASAGEDENATKIKQTGLSQATYPVGS